MQLNNKRVLCKRMLYKTIVSFILVLGLTSTHVQAEDTKTSDGKLLDILATYDYILEIDPYKDIDGCGFTADSFNLMDFDLDGIPELIINSDENRTKYLGNVDYVKGL